MHKKLIIVCMAIAAFAAFVIAPAASASPVLTESGKALAAGASVKGTNTGNVKFTLSTGGAVECTHAEIRGTVTTDSGTKIKGEIPVGGSSFSGTGPGSDCTGNGGGPGPMRPTLTSKLCWETVGEDKVTITGCGTTITFALHMTIEAIACAYSTASFSGTYVTGADATINVNEQEAGREVGQSPLCPASWKLDMDIDLTTTDGTTLSIS